MVVANATRDMADDRGKGTGMVFDWETKLGCKMPVQFSRISNATDPPARSRSNQRKCHEWRRRVVRRCRASRRRTIPRRRPKS
jgi:hypothetical protein